MKRYCYLSDGPGAGDRSVQELEISGRHRPQIDIFSQDDNTVAVHHQLHNFEFVFNKKRFPNRDFSCFDEQLRKWRHQFPSAVGPQQEASIARR